MSTYQSQPLYTYLSRFRAGMVDADLVYSEHLESLINWFLVNSGVAYLHAHYATRGCCAARVERA